MNDPFLAAEVRRLREELADTQRQKYGTPCKCEAWIAVARDAEEKLEVLRRSHARLLAAIKASRGGTGVCTCSTSSCAELRAAVAEAEKL